MFRIKNKWLVLLGALLAQLSIGSIYSWSLFNGPIVEAYNVSLDKVVTTYQIAIFFFAFATLFSGPLYIRKGPKVTALLGAGLYAGGVFLSAFAKTPEMLYLTYGVISGLGVGTVYVVPLATLIKWFPNKKGTFTGVAVGTFGAGSIIFKYVIEYFLGNGPYTPASIQTTFISLAVVYLVIGGIGALLIDLPTESTKEKAVSEGDYKPSHMIKTKNFAFMFIGFLLCTLPGILTIGLARDIGIELVGLDLKVAGTIVTVAAIANASGRLISGIASDRFGAHNVMKVMGIVSVLALAMFTFMDLNYFTFIIAILGVVASYGSFLALYPNLVQKKFGQSYYSANYGIVYQGYGLAALAGALLKSNTTGFNQTFMVAMIIALAGAFFVFRFKPQPKYQAPLSTTKKRRA